MYFITILLYLFLYPCTYIFRCVMYWKITWLSFIHTSAMKIVPLVVWVYTISFVKCFDIEVFCLFWISPVNNCESIKKNIFTVLSLFLKALNFCFCQVSRSFDYIISINCFFNKTYQSDGNQNQSPINMCYS